MIQTSLFKDIPDGTYPMEIHNTKETKDDRVEILMYINSPTEKTLIPLVDTMYFEDYASKFLATGANHVRIENNKVQEYVYWKKKTKVEIDKPKVDKPKVDLINSPKHYKFFGKNSITMFRRHLSEAEFIGYCKGCSLKYRLRAGKKEGSGAEQDILKAKKFEEYFENYFNEQYWNKLDES